MRAKFIGRLTLWLAGLGLLLGVAALPGWAATPAPGADLFTIDLLTTNKGSGTARFDPGETTQFLVSVSRSATATLTVHRYLGGDTRIWTNVTLHGGLTYSVWATAGDPGPRDLVLTATDGVTTDTATCYYEVNPSPIHPDRTTTIELLATNQGQGASFAPGQPFRIEFRLSDPAPATLSIERADGSRSSVLFTDQMFAGGTTYHTDVTADDPGTWIIHLASGTGPATVSPDLQACVYTVTGADPPLPTQLIQEFTTNKGTAAHFTPGEPIQIWVRLSRSATITGEAVRADGGAGWPWAPTQVLAGGQTYSWQVPFSFASGDQWILKLTAVADAVTETATCSFIVVAPSPVASSTSGTSGAPPPLVPPASGVSPPPVP